MLTWDRLMLRASQSLAGQRIMQIGAQKSAKDHTSSSPCCTLLLHNQLQFWWWMGPSSPALCLQPSSWVVSAERQSATHLVFLPGERLISGVYAPHIHQVAINNNCRYCPNCSFLSISLFFSLSPLYFSLSLSPPLSFSLSPSLPLFHSLSRFLARYRSLFLRVWFALMLKCVIFLSFLFCSPVLRDKKRKFRRDRCTRWIPPLSTSGSISVR